MKSTSKADRETKAAGKRFPWRILAQVMVLGLALGFLGVLVRIQSGALQSYNWQLAPGWAILSLVGLLLTWGFEIATWRLLLARLGGRLTYRRAMRVWYLSNIIRYIPGNIWQFLGMAELAAEDGVPRVVTLSSAVLHQVISIIAGVILALVFFAAAGQGEWLVRLRPLVLLAPLGLVLLQPRLLERALNWGLARLHRPPVQVTLTWCDICVLTLRYGVVWVGLGMSFAALVRGITPTGWEVTPFLAASWVAAYVVGYLSMLTPSGLGVREAALALLLTPVMPQAIAAVVAIVARLWMVLGELIGAGASLWLGRSQGTGEVQQGDCDETQAA